MARIAMIMILIILAAISRIIPHPPNFAPVGAIALFSGYAIGSRWSYAIPILVMLISDFFIGFHALMLPVYLAVLINVYIGQRIRPKYALLGAFAGSIVFFLVTNFAVWLMYDERTFATLAECYVIAIPFYRNSLCGDLVYTGALFGAMTFSEYKFPILRRVQVATWPDRHATVLEDSES